MDGRVNRFRHRSRLLRRYSTADGRLWNSRSCWTGAALGDARSASRIARNHSEGVLLYVDRRSYHSVLSYSPVLRSALDFRPPPRHICLIAPFLVAVAASSEVRRQIAERVRASLLLFICAAGFFVVATLSVLTSISPTESTSALVDAVLSWYDVVFLLKIICLCAIFNPGAGIVEFFLKHRFFIDIFPKGMLATMIDNNPSLTNLLPNPQDFRNGLFRASSTFVTPLSFGEFQIIVIPIGLFFLLHRETLVDRLLGGAVAFGGIVGIICSGSRAGFVGVIASVAVFVAFYSIRKAVSSKGSLAPAIAGLLGIIGFGCVIGAILLFHQVHDMVLGGTAQSSSTDARYIQWAAGTPFIKQIRSPGTVSGWGASLSGWARSTATSCRSSSRRGSPDLFFLSGCSCSRSGMAYGIISLICRNPARWPARWLAVS
jgi:hypothetical protein